MSGTRDIILQELEQRDPALATIAEEQSGAARLLNELPVRLTIETVATDVESHRTWELAGLYFIRSGRLYEGLAIFWGLYQQMLVAQEQTRRLHKGMPLVWMSDCYAQLGFPVHAKRYLMLTLVEDALREHGTVTPETDRHVLSSCVGARRLSFGGEPLCGGVRTARPTVTRACLIS